jgi:predicted Zn-dependent protease
MPLKKKNKTHCAILYVHPNNLLPSCTAGQIVVRAGRVHRASEMVQPLDARIAQQEEVNQNFSSMLLAGRYNYLSRILISAVF